MNSFVVYNRGGEKMLNFMCDRLPSLNNKYLILSTLDKLEFSELHYVIWTIPNNDRNRTFKFEGQHKTADEFMREFLKICDGNCLFGVDLFLK